MKKKIQQFLSIILALVMIFNILPLQVFSADDFVIEDATSEEAPSGSSSYERKDTVKVVEEDTSKRGEYYKEFVLNNGLRLATIYPDAVHYEENGEWKEIDNTLIPTTASGISTYSNTSGVWDVHFPRCFASDNQISISKDGYTVTFGMAGNLTSNPKTENETIAVSAVSSENRTHLHESLTVGSSKVSYGQIQQLQISQFVEATEYKETVPDKLYARLTYPAVYDSTDVVYDLQSNQIKESIIIHEYDAALWGYRYTLNTDGLIPIINDNCSIDLCDPINDIVIMSMPAPFMVDNNGEYSYDVNVELTKNGSAYLLTYYLPRKWLAEEDRAWPVVLDPIVNANNNRTNIQDITVAENDTESYNAETIKCGYHLTKGILRTYLRYEELPALTSSDFVVSAVIRLAKPYDSDLSAPIEVHKVTQTWDSTEISWSDDIKYDETVEDFAIVEDSAWYQWDVTNIVQGWYNDSHNELINNTGMLFKATDSVEQGGVKNWQQFCSSDYSISENRPYLTIMFRNNNGLERYWDYTASSAGRAGTGYVNNYTGNLVWVHDDIGFGGNRMPVSISHIYNANDAAARVQGCSDLKYFGLGYGWRTNYNQYVTTWTDTKTATKYFVWADSDGTNHYFYNTSGNEYQDEDGLDLILKADNSSPLACSIVDKYGNTSYFDSKGRLYKQENNQETKSSISITYWGENSYQISTITDGAGRVYSFNYSAGILRKISYLGTNNTEISYVTYEYDSYTGPNLVSIKDKDGKGGTYTYDANSMLIKASDVDGYELNYTYSFSGNTKPGRIIQISENDGSAEGGTLNIEYSHNQTTFTDHNSNVQIMQFNNWGNTVSIQDGEGRAQFSEYEYVPLESQKTTSKGNQLNAVSKLQNTVGNMLKDSSFEKEVGWTNVNTSVSHTISSDAAYYGSKALKLIRSTAGTASGVYSSYFTATAGESYTFSAYVKTTDNATAYLALRDSANVVVTSEETEVNCDWTRLEVTYTNTATSSRTIRARLLTTTAGTVYMDCAQLEKAETASRYNLIENGDFRYNGFSWFINSAADENETRVTVDKSAAPQLDNYAYQITGDPETHLRLRQEVQVSGQAGDTFVLAAWAKGDAVPIGERDGVERTFTIRGTFENTDGTTTPFSFDFNPDTDSNSNWQYAAGVMVADKPYSFINVRVMYGYNANVMLFDGIQLYKEEFGSSYDYDENGNIKSVKDIQGQITSYEYTDNDLTKTTLPTGAELTYTYDDYHNPKTATTNEGVAYNFEYDTFGNNTSVSIGSITSTADYTDDGNRLETTTDALGNTTTYSYNADTNVLEWVQNPNDSVSTRTTYTYDSMYRLATVSANVDGLSEGTALTAIYGYTDDLMTSLQTESTIYTFAYGDFALRSSIKIGSRVLAGYDYTDDGNNYLSELAYGNGDAVRYSYDKYGRLINQLYADGDTINYKFDNSGGLAYMYDSATDRTTKYFYDFTDRLMKYTETGNGIDHSVVYAYDKLNNLSSLTEKINGSTYTTNYTYDNDNRVTEVENNSSTRNYIYDDFSRLEQRTTYHGDTKVLTEDFTFSTAGGRKSNQIASQKYSFALRSIMQYYEYDNNGNIVTFGEGTDTGKATEGFCTTYVYDSQNQLIRENNIDKNRSWVWTYDNAGNITSRSEYAYTLGELGEPLDVVIYLYEDADWGDLLTSYDGKTITYDKIGNPLNDGTWTYTWEHGRQLAAMSNGTTTWNYSYDANGMRTSRTDGTTTYTYVYNGGKLTRMTAGNHVLDFAYDAAGLPMTVTYDGTTYYYLTNIQGDVISIVDANGILVAHYTYDAWGNPHSTSVSTDGVAGLNPLRYRSYVYDQETGLYYLQSRYYNPQIGRFINSDVLTSTGQGTLGNNMFAYCGNNPVIRIDSSGTFWDVVFDVISLCASVVDVVQNPDDVGAWVGLACDVVDVVVPVVSGLGEASRAINAGLEVADTLDDIHDAGKVAGNIGDATKVTFETVEVKLPTQIKMNESVDMWDDFLGPNQTSFNKYTGKHDMDRIFSADGTRSIRFSSHEMNSLSTTKAHFHYEEWIYGPENNVVIIYNQLQRVR